MKSKIFLVIVILLNCLMSIAQYAEIQVKEKFDAFNLMEINQHHICDVKPIDYKIDDPTFDVEGSTIGDGLSKLLEGLLTMYETTNDKAYLNKFILQSLCVVENRHDLIGAAGNNEPRWAINKQVYHDGYTIAALARFVHLVKQEDTYLINEPLYQFEELLPNSYEPNTCNCNNFNITFDTYGKYADFLMVRSIETLNWFLANGYWEDSKGIKKDTENDTKAAEINMQVGFARALLFLGLSIPSQNYLNKAHIIAEQQDESINQIDSEQSDTNMQDYFEVKIYPNPTDKHLNIVGNNIKSIKIINLLGEVVYYNVNTIYQNHNVLNVSTIEKGMYFVITLDTLENSVSKSVIIK